jgi:mono/diheme cytochrome c family protein
MNSTSRVPSQVASLRRCVACISLDGRSSKDVMPASQLQQEYHALAQLSLISVTSQLWLIMSLAMVIACGCDRRSSQADPPSYRPQGPSDLFADGSSERALVAGVVPRPVDRSPGIPYVTVKGPGPVGMEGSPVTASIPFGVTDAVIARGRERFDINCAACHGRTGEGDGIIVQRGFTHPPSYYSQPLLDAPDSHFFDVITNGKGAMFSFDDRITPDDRWAIVAYIRTLQQAARSAPADSRPPSYGGASQ